MSNKPRKSNRREFLKTTAAAMAGFGVWVVTRDGLAAPGAAPAAPVAASEKLNVAFVGVAGRGGSNFSEVANNPSVNVVALCDVNEANMDELAGTHTDASLHTDFRKMLDERHKEIDAVVVSTADHCHVPASIAAIRLDKHVYCEKPLAHNVWEARLVAREAAERKRVTQMGTQIHAGSNYRRAVEIVQAGVIGPVREVHVFINKMWSPVNDPKREVLPVPAGLNFDAWLGPAPEQPYTSNILPANWRKWWQFGNGTLGDMGCHYMDLPFWALKLKYPTRIEAEGPPVDKEGTPAWIIVNYDYPEREGGPDGAKLPPVRMTWYDGSAGKRPMKWQEWGFPDDWQNGVVFVGEKGRLFADYNQHKLSPDSLTAGVPKPSIPESIGHHNEWVKACLENNPAATTCRFDYSGPLTETVLLGTLAYRVGKPIEWDAENLKATNAPEADQYVKREYRKGWEI